MWIRISLIVLSGDLIKKGLRLGEEDVTYKMNSTVLSGDLIKKGLRPWLTSAKCSPAAF